MRYAEPTEIADGDEIEFYRPFHWRGQDTVNKQSSGEDLDHTLQWRLEDEQDEAHKYLRHIYKSRIERGVSREMARIDLPLSTYTKWFWKNDLHNTLHFLKLRMDPHAQWEIRKYAEAMYGLLTVRLPVIMGLWEEIREDSNLRQP